VPTASSHSRRRAPARCGRRGRRLAPRLSLLTIHVTNERR
jgi:hypothetical protein